MALWGQPGAARDRRTGSRTSPCACAAPCAAIEAQHRHLRALFGEVEGACATAAPAAPDAPLTRLRDALRGALRARGAGGLPGAARPLALRRSRDRRRSEREHERFLARARRHARGRRGLRRATASRVCARRSAITSGARSSSLEGIAGLERSGRRSRVEPRRDAHRILRSAGYNRLSASAWRPPLREARWHVTCTPGARGGIADAHLPEDRRPDRLLRALRRARSTWRSSSRKQFKGHDPPVHSYPINPILLSPYGVADAARSRAQLPRGLRQAARRSGRSARARPASTVEIFTTSDTPVGGDRRTTRRRSART